MATFSDDFSGHTAGDTATVSAPTGIANWTADFPAGSASQVTGQIVTDAGAPGGQVLRLLDTGFGASNKSMRPTALGAIADDTDTEILVLWRIESAGQTSLHEAIYAPGFIRQNTASMGRRYQVGLNLASSVFAHRLWYVQESNPWVGVGASKTPVSTYALGDWWWTRVQVDTGTTANWRWRTWKDGDTEPGSWQNADTANTTVRGGYCGVGSYATSTNNHMDIGWFSVGTGGDAAPEPSAGSSQAPRSIHILNMMRGY